MAMNWILFLASAYAFRAIVLQKPEQESRTREASTIAIHLHVLSAKHFHYKPCSSLVFLTKLSWPPQRWQVSFYANLITSPLIRLGNLLWNGPLCASAARIQRREKRSSVRHPTSRLALCHKLIEMHAALVASASRFAANMYENAQRHDACRWDSRPNAVHSSVPNVSCAGLVAHSISQFCCFCLRWFCLLSAYFAGLFMGVHCLVMSRRLFNCARNIEKKVLSFFLSWQLLLSVHCQEAVIIFA